MSIPYVSGLSLNGVPVPLAIEGANGTRLERGATMDAFVADVAVKGVEIALVRADARIAGTDPAAAEAAFAVAQDAAIPVALTPVAPQPGGLR